MWATAVDAKYKKHEAFMPNKKAKNYEADEDENEDVVADIRI